MTLPQLAADDQVNLENRLPQQLRLAAHTRNSDRLIVCLSELPADSEFACAPAATMVPRDCFPYFLSWLGMAEEDMNVVVQATASAQAIEVLWPAYNA